MFKSVGFAIYDLYRYFFDLKINPLRHIPNELGPKTPPLPARRVTWDLEKEG